MTLSDKSLTCVECNETFTFTVGEQEFFASKGYTNEPKRCPTCRDSRRSQQRGDRMGRAGAISGGLCRVWSRRHGPLQAPWGTGPYTVVTASAV